MRKFDRYWFRKGETENEVPSDWLKAVRIALIPADERTVEEMLRRWLEEPLLYIHRLSY